MPLNPTQRAFATSTAPYPAFCGGLGSGKTATAIARAMALKSHFKENDIAYYLPTYPLIEDIVHRRFPELCEAKGWAYTLNKTSNFIEFPGSGRIIFRTMDNPARIVGYEVAHSLVDELDTLPIDKAREVWNKIIARNRQKCPMPNSVAVATTPEGFRFVYERWVKNASPKYVLYRARTLDNAENLPPEYIDNLRATYSPQLLAAYLDGEFVNLTAGSVYPEFSRTLNASQETIRREVRNQNNQVTQSAETLHVGMDFNVTRMAAVIHVLRSDNPHAVEELTNVFDTPTMIRVIKDRYAGHPIIVYPDASGKSRKSTNASESDISLLQQAQFAVYHNPANPAVRDRVLSVNNLIHNQGGRRYFVNTDKCPHLTEALEKQAYDANGEPDKSSGLDHLVDATGYFVAYRWPIVKRVAEFKSLRL